MTGRSRTVSGVAAAWFLSLGFDFFLHGGLLARLYVEPSPFLLGPEDAMRRIPLGYLAFLILTLALYWLLRRLHATGLGAGFRYGAAAGAVVWGALAIGLYSISTARLALLAAWWIGQSIELGLAGAVLGAVASGVSLRRIWTVVGGVVLVFFVATVVLQSMGLAPPMRTERMVDVGPHRLEVRIAGEGAPVVVIDAGVTDQLDKLIPLQDRIAQVTRVVTYNRAGYGRSEPGPLPRDSGCEADELKALLEKASIPGPYVLVGHSLGALNVQVFAARHPDLVAGLVLLDPPPLSFILGAEYKDLGAMAEKMTAEWQGIADAAAKSADPSEKARAGFFQMIASEHREMFGESARLAGAIHTFGDTPLVVVAAGRPNPAFGEAADAFQKYWIDQSRALSGKSTNGKFIVAEQSSHYLYLEAPDLVAESVLSVVREAQGKQDRTWNSHEETPATEQPAISACLSRRTAE